MSSGLRINKASDDAAGLAVASSLKADTRIYSQGVRNLNDGVSALNIADGALANLSSIVVRMEELAEQSANGAVGFKQRKSLDAEAQALAKEYFRISRTTDFNGLELFDGSVQGLSLQTGYGTGGSIISSLGGALGTGTFGSSLSYQTESGESRGLAIADLDGDAILDLATAGTDGYATIRLGNGDGTFKAAHSCQQEMVSSNSISLSDLNGDSILDLVTAGEHWDYGTTSIRLGNGDGTFKARLAYRSEGAWSNALSIADVNGDGVQDLVTAGPGIGDVYATIRLGNGDGTFKKALSYQAELNGCYAVSVTDVNSDGALDLVTAGGGPGPEGSATIRLGNGDGTFKEALSYQTEAAASYAVSVSDVNGDGVPDLITAGTNQGGSQGYATIRLGNGDGTFRGERSYETDGGGGNGLSYALCLSDTNGDGALDLVTAGWGGAGQATIRLGNGDGSFRTGVSYQTEIASSYALSMTDLNGDGVPDLVTAGNGGGGKVSIRLACTEDGISPILPFSLKTQADSLQALSMLKNTAERLSYQRGQIGAFQSRLSSALNTLGSTVLEYKGAQSRVEDVDIAGESASLLRQQIIQQAASSVLAQANQGPALALRLLQA